MKLPELIKTFTDGTSQYVDSTVEPSKQYEYNIVAVDESGLKTDAPNRLQIKIPDNSSRYTIKALNSYINTKEHYIEIFWRDDLKNVQAYNVYKKTKGKPITLWKVVNIGEVKRLTDSNVMIGEAYEYAVMPIMKTGMKGKMVVMEVKY